MKSRFLDVDGVHSEEEAIRWSINAAVGVRKGGRIYQTDGDREGFRSEWENLLRNYAQRYVRSDKQLTDDEHCAVIREIAETLSARHQDLLVNGRLRYGVSQKALNLYLKYLWCLGKIPLPPHCPVDRIILEAAGIDGSWTLCDSEKEYMEWINHLRAVAAPASLAEWELETWLLNRPTA